MFVAGNVKGKAAQAELAKNFAVEELEEVCVCVFIKLHITAQSGPVILVILCHSH